ncbi:MAG: metallophosphoesterase, partial [Methanosarcinaceae archaeon]|nr:metallophosphoesterase [Methanosarcinaceae archaeon]
HENEDTLLTALEYYQSHEFKLILAGDIEELWQYSLEEARARYGLTIYAAIRKFGDQNVYRIFGNHDCDWCAVPRDPTRNEPKSLDIAVEGLKMKDRNGETKIIICHGHQGNVESDKEKWISRPAVRLFRLIEPAIKMIGITRHPPAIRSQIIKLYERIFYHWAKRTGVLIICGHSHRAIFASKSWIEICREKRDKIKDSIKANRSDRQFVKGKRQELKELDKEIKKDLKRGLEITSVEVDHAPYPLYFNTGCGLYADGITGIEIENDVIKLVKWSRGKNPPPEIYQKGILSDFINQIP